MSYFTPTDDKATRIGERIGAVVTAAIFIGFSIVFIVSLISH